MLGWNTVDYGDRMPFWYQGYWEGREMWLLVNDPSDGADSDQLGFPQTAENGKLPSGVVPTGDSMTGIGRLKSCDSTDSDEAPTIKRWTNEGYKPVDEDFSAYS